MSYDEEFSELMIKNLDDLKSEYYSGKISKDDLSKRIVNLVGAIEEATRTGAISAETFTKIYDSVGEFCEQIDCGTCLADEDLNDCDIADEGLNNDDIIL